MNLINKFVIASVMNVVNEVWQSPDPEVSSLWRSPRHIKSTCLAMTGSIYSLNNHQLELIK